MRVETKSMTSEASDIMHLAEDSDAEELDSWEEGRDFDLERKKDKLIRRIIKLVGSDEEKRPLNVAVIGPMGVGKSSFINTTAAALSGDRWREYAYTGSHGGDGSQITVFTNSYPKCCMAENTKFIQVALPTFIDIAGFSDEDNDKWVELLKIVFYGRLPEGESLAEAEHYYRDNGMKGLMEKYSSNDEKLKVDRIIFVSAAKNQVPVNLIKAVIRAARPLGTKENPMKRTIPIYGVMTKADKVGGPELSQSEYDETEKAFIEALGLQGSRHRFLLCQNYCDDVDVDKKRTETLLPALDIPVLQFMIQVCDPVIRVINEGEAYSSTRPTEAGQHQLDERTDTRRGAVVDSSSDAARFAPRSPLMSFLREMGLSDTYISLLVIAVEAILVAFLLNLILRPSLDTGKLKVACSYARDRQELKVFEDICNSLDTTFGARFFTMLLLFALILLRIGVTLFFKRFYRQDGGTDQTYGANQ
ncbi:uncharacterized protein LOC121383405 isoform X1 [Gigantopelta aegis]|uniref:uncharacterized protein LOC121383405 isoform X1 n=1 Tax=Gigantopelta aegis TaxID=1735272 RepID=UPI001B88DDC6|nr:uncharacterized protein LOC121383405 isoform X1 [Gigantopelta aegis]